MKDPWLSKKEEVNFPVGWHVSGFGKRAICLGMSTATHASRGWTCLFRTAYNLSPATASLTHVTHAFHIPTTMIKVPPPQDPSLLFRFLLSVTDMEHEEGRERRGKEEAEDQCCSNSGAERCASSLGRVAPAHVLFFSHTDLTELDLPSTMKTSFVDPADLLNFTLTITPDEGQCCTTIDQ